MSEVTTAHLALGIAAMGIVSSVGTALGLFLLQRLFGGGDDIRNKVNALEVEILKYRNETREHVADKYVTQEDMRDFQRTIERSIEGLAARVTEHTTTVTALLGPIADQLVISPIRRGHGT